MDLTIYPGISMDRVHQNGDGGPVRVHHISVREAQDGGVQVYAHALTPAGSERKKVDARLHPPTNLGGLIHVGQVYAKDWRAFNPCGVAYTPVRTGIYEARKRAGQPTNYPTIRNHPMRNFVVDPKLLDVPNYLWQAYFLGPRQLEDEDIRAIISFFGHNVNPRVRVMGAAPDYGGNVGVHLTTIPLDFDGPRSEPFRYFHTVTTIMPGQLRVRTGIVGFAQFLAILPVDARANPTGYAEFAKETMAKAQNRAPALAANPAPA